MASASSNATSMTVHIDGVDVLWPYDAVYDEQLDCMAALKACFDANDDDDAARAPAPAPAPAWSFVASRAGTPGRKRRPSGAKLAA